MSYNILNKNVKFAGSTQGTIEDVVDTHSSQSISGSKDFLSLTASVGRVKNDLTVIGNVSASVNISASAFYGDGSNLANVGTVTFDGNTTDGVLTYKDSDEATVESTLTYDGLNKRLTLAEPGNTGEIILHGTLSGSGNISGSVFYGSAAGLTGLASAVSLATNSGLEDSSGLRVNPNGAAGLVGSIADNDEIIIYSTADGAPRKTTVVNVASRATVPISAYTNGSALVDKVVVSVDSTGVKVQSNLSFDNTLLALTGNMSSSGYLQVGGEITGSAISLSDASSLAGAGLINNSGTIDIEVTGAMKLASDRLGISGSIAGNGLLFAGGPDSVSSLAVNLQTTPGLEVATSGLRLRGSTLASGTPVLSSDSIAYIGASSDSKCTISTFMSGVAGSGLSELGGVLRIDLDQMATGSVDTLTDDFVFIDDSDNVTKKESINDLVSAIAGGGLENSSGALRLEVSGALFAPIGVSDKLGISGSIAGSGLGFSGGANSISSLNLDLMDKGFGGGANKIITDDGDGSVTCEANLTFDGTTLNLTGNLHLGDGTQNGLFAQSSNNQQIQFGIDNNFGIYYDEAQSDTLVIAGNNAGSDVVFICSQNDQDARLTLASDGWADAGDAWQFQSRGHPSENNKLIIGNDIASKGVAAAHLTITPNTNTMNSLVEIAGSGSMAYLTVSGSALRSRAIIQSPNSVPADALLHSGSYSFYLDEGNNKLKVRVKYGDGTMKTGEISLT